MANQHLSLQQQALLLPACTTAEFRQFDFWLGKWIVRNPDGNQTGSSEISRVFGRLRGSRRLDCRQRQVWYEH